LKTIRTFIAALRTLTVIPWPGKEIRELSSSLPWFPVVGFILGLILYGTGHMWMLLPFSQWTAGGALLLVAVEIWLTRGLHLDGLADWADSFGGFEREQRLAIMKDVSLGAFGVMALVLALMAKWVAFERLLSSDSIVWLLAIFTISRCMLVELIVTLPYARASDGMAGPFVKGASRRHRLASHVLSLGLCLFFGPLALAFYGLAWLITRLFRARCLKQFGGITGDLLGTANEMVEISLVMICALSGKGILCYTGWGWVF
jgi:adenosylcobinamide-GDP ribazoletransferase